MTRSHTHFRVLCISLLFNFQRPARFLVSRRVSLYSISHTVAFVKTFFESFLSFFRFSFKTFSFTLDLSIADLYYITSRDFCQDLFESFFRLFSIFSLLFSLSLRLTLSGLVVYHISFPLSRENQTFFAPKNQVHLLLISRFQFYKS